MSLRRRLLITLCPLFVAALVLADAGTYVALRSFMLSRVDRQLRDGHVGIELALAARANLIGSGPGGPGPDRPGGPVSLPSGTYAELRSPSGEVLASYSVGPADSGGRPVLPATLTPGTSLLFTAPGSGGAGSYRVYVETASGPAAGDLLMVAVPLDDVQSTLQQLLVLELAIAGGVTLLVVLATTLLVRRGLRPLERIGSTARSIVLSDLSQRVTPATERTEVGRLGLALNSMLGQLEEAFTEREANEQRLRHFVSDASHELRTPLTSMRGYAELLRRNPEMSAEDMTLAMRRIDEETQRMGILVDDLLLLARLDQGRPLESRPVDLEALVADACADARAADGDRAIGTRVTAPLVVAGDQMRLRQVLSNLLRNALVHTPPGTSVEVGLRRDGGSAVLEVIDHGRGIAPEHAGRIFERFYRADAARSGDQGGSGLGLSIAAAVVQAHGGRIAVDRTPGGGATFRILLPLPDGQGVR
ncbi:MAG: integral rane sensor signal transduction histidine kinase [Chloroflexi bacterium]|jgi:two-component system OmpR family sensor kinase|nr:integral rane sensor signal transduction histidine kinase [Chloroflexota bacterium]